jgi:hypothetical protein
MTVDEVEEIRLKAGRLQALGQNWQAQNLMKDMRLQVLETIAKGHARSATALAYRATLPPIEPSA